MGVVYKGRDPEIGRLVAIKTLKSVFMGDDPAGAEAMERFRLESRSAGKLHHPNIVTIFEAGRTESGSPYIVMEYIEGQSLESIIADTGPLDPPAVIHYLAQIAAAIDYAHSQSVIHRDIKPSNILADSSHSAHLLDFGVAKLSDTSLTPAGTVVGTPSYMSPEQIRGAKLDGKTDFFSLAVVAFECFAGVRPFPGNDFTTVVSNIIHKQPLTFSELGLDLPAELEAVLGKGLSKEREQRSATALEFITQIADVFKLVVDANGIPGGYHGELLWKSSSDQEAVEHSSLLKAPDHMNGTISSIEEVEGGEEASDAAAESEEVLDRTMMSDPEEGRAAARAALASLSEADDVKKAVSLRLAAGALFSCLALVGAAFFFMSEKDQVSSSAETSTVMRVVEDSPKEKPEVVSSPKADFPPPIVPQGGFDKVSVSLLSANELQGLLAYSDVDKESLRLAIEEVSVRKFTEALPQLISKVNHEDFRVRVAIIKAFGKLDALADEGVQTKLIALLGDSEALVRGFAAKSLAESQTTAAEKALLEKQESETNPVVKKVLAQSLMRFKK